MLICFILEFIGILSVLDVYDSYVFVNEQVVGDLVSHNFHQFWMIRFFFFKHHYRFFVNFSHQIPSFLYIKYLHL